MTTKHQILSITISDEQGLGLPPRMTGDEILALISDEDDGTRIEVMRDMPVTLDSGFIAYQLDVEFDPNEVDEPGTWNWAGVYDSRWRIGVMSIGPVHD